ncbi:hypothetical protein [Pseudomonas sp. rhizo25]|uniref:hypothetical protein n=1 Tax=Pseudomonas sp. rhizo25 TaxID=3059675 RepID=UPI00288EE1E8|nr:hypothetical protein [Pseudomonas sp. rhizo25]MDT3230878.1 hypothetical protein [Pseudomonas sp. rhizo25]
MSYFYSLIGNEVQKMRDDQEVVRAAAENIARRAGAIKECEFHGEILTNDCDGEAFALGNSLYDSEFRGVFSSRDEMNAAIQSVLSDAAWDCGLCDKNRDD